MDRLDLVDPSLYLDGVKVSWQVSTTTLTPGPQAYAYLGAGFTGAGWSGLTANTTNYYSGSLAEAAFFDSELTPAQVDAQWQASKQTVPVAVTTIANTVTNITMPVKTVTVTDQAVSRAARGPLPDLSVRSSRRISPLWSVTLAAPVRR